jgi:phospholipid/cholesterol/gamma-HCH transport system permease protein
MPSVPVRKFMRACYYLGSPLVSVSQTTYDIGHVAWRATASMPSIGRELSVIMSRFQVLIMRCTVLVAVASFSAGMLMTLQFSVGVGRFGGRMYVPTLVAMSIIKALGPMLAALMVASRSGGGLAAELAGMNTTQQTDAIMALGSSVDRKLIMPNIVALAIGLPCLTLISDFSGLLGGGLGAMGNLGLPPSLILQKISAAVNAKDLWSGVLKTAPQGILIGIVACYYGLRAQGGTAGVGHATTSAIVTGTLLVLLSDLILTKFIWLIT